MFDVGIHVVIELPALEPIALKQILERSYMLAKLPIDRAERKVNLNAFVRFDPLLLQQALHHRNLGISGGKPLELGKREVVKRLVRSDLVQFLGCGERIRQAARRRVPWTLCASTRGHNWRRLPGGVVAGDALVVPSQLPQSLAAITMRLHDIRPQPDGLVAAFNDLSSNAQAP